MRNPILEIKGLAVDTATARTASMRCVAST
jgi:hypothetical protein